MVDISARLRDSLGGRYEIERELGHGGMAHVFLARDLKHERPVAIKVIRPELSASIGSDRFLREIKIAAKLQHPHIVPLYDSGEADGLLYYVMPFVEGEALRERMKREKQLPLEDALQISRDMAEALSYAHSQGIVHRDIKPENVLISGEEAMVADFGIAHAVSEAGGVSLTDSGMVIGTPAYMSPEQATGEHELDSRSDIYSLGCVLYEMLAGETPFTGPSGQAIIARHVSQPPPSLRIVRPSVPLSVEQALEKSLAKVPADRYATAHQFSQALTRGSAAVSLRRVKRWVWATAWSAAAVLVLVSGFLIVPRVFFGTRLNPRNHVVGSLVEAGVAVDTHVPRQLEGALQDAVRQMPDVSLEESTRINNQRRELGEPRTISDWFQIARSVGAGRLVLVSITAVGDSTEVVGLYYDVRTGNSLGRATKMLAAGAVDTHAFVEDFAEHLFNLPEETLTLPFYGSADSQAEFLSGMMAFELLDLPQAETHFQRSTELDPQHAKAQMWLARVRLLLGRSPVEWVGAARLAVESGVLLGDEALAAQALLDMAEGEFPQACEHYRQMRDANRSSFHAWYGLAECHRLDRTVVPDSQSPSRWRYRSSYHQAVVAYERAFDLVPSIAFAFRQDAFERLRKILFTQTNDWRIGIAARPDTGLFASYPGLDNDTLTFVPYRLLDVAGAEAGTTPPTRRDALDWNRDFLTRLVNRWYEAFPDSSAPNWALAMALEVKSELEGRQGSAIEAARRARRMANTADDSLKAALVEIQILVKLRRFEEVRESADVVLVYWRSPTPEQARQLSGVAALVGRPHLSADLHELGAPMLRQEPGEPIAELDLPVLERRQRLMGYAVVGAPRDSITTLSSEMENLLEVHATAEQRRRLECRLVWQPLEHAYPVVGLVTDDQTCWAESYVRELQWAASVGDSARIREILRELDLARSDQRPGEIAIDITYEEAWVSLQIGDTAWAVDHLDASLAALETLGPYLLSEPSQAAGLVRAMALRAELAAAAGDERTAERWAGQVVTLWGETEDEELQGLVRKMEGFM